MRSSSELAEVLSHRGRVLVLVILTAFCLPPSGAWAQVDVNETGLHDNAVVYGVQVPTTEPVYLNVDDIAVWAWGQTDPNLYANVTFSAYGLYSDANLASTGAIDVNAAGGNAASNSGLAAAHTMSVMGLRAGADANNTGAITIVTRAGTANSTSEGAYASVSEAAGVYAEGDIYNAGDITIAATGGTVNGADDAYASSYAVGLDTARSASNSGTLSITAMGGSATIDGGVGTASTKATAYGINSDENIINAGLITATASGGMATARTPSADPNATAYADTSAEAYGLLAQSNASNSGGIIATATGGSGAASTGGYAYTRTKGIFAAMDVTNSASITAVATGGSIDANDTADAHSEAFGIDSRSVDNSGDVIVTAVGGTAVAADARADAEAYGITASGGVNNTGDITVVARGGSGAVETANVHAQAYGLTGSNGTVNNSGNISVAAIAGTVAGVYTADTVDYSHAVGIRVTSADLLNSGDIAATASGSVSLSDVYAIIADNASVNNSGDITATATSETAWTSRVFGIFTVGETTLTNTGIIRTSADRTYEVYVGGGTTTLAGTYNVTLDGNPSQAAFSITEQATLALNNATLTATAIAGETLWDTPYKLFETGGTGVVDGNFADVQAAYPNTRVTYYDQGTAGSVDDTVALSYAPVASTASHSAGVERQIVFQASEAIGQRMTGALLQNVLAPPASPLLASAGSTAESMALAHSAPQKKSTGVFFEPYYSRLDQEADPLGYTARLSGFAAGYEQSVENTLFNLYAGYGQSDIHYSGAGYSNNMEDQDVATAGLSGLTRRDPWTLRYGVTGFYGWHEYTGLTGLSLDEREIASYNSYGAAATVMAGRVFRHKNHALLPEAGVTYLWAHRNSYTTEAADPSWNTTYSTLDDHDVQAEAALRWLSEFMHGNMHVTPSVAVGVRHLLTDNETSAWLSVPGATPVLVTSRRDRTALTLSGSLVVNEDGRAASLAYDGEYGNDSQRHSVWLRLSWLF